MNIYSRLEEAFQNKAYKLLAFTEGNVFLGFISYWQFDTYYYIDDSAESVPCVAL